MRRPSRFFQIMGAFALALVVSACASTYPTREVSEKEVALKRPAAPVSEDKLLSVRIETFDPGKLPEDPDLAKGLSKEIRDAEAYYIPVQLKITMQRSGHWGPIRVVPKGSREGEIVSTGRIVDSDGELLKLEISVRDASGVHWFTKEYEGVVNEDKQNSAEQQRVDAFQSVYNEIANDIADYKNKLATKDAAAIRQLAALRFGSDFAPTVFGDYVQNTAANKQKSEPDALQELVAILDAAPPESEREPVYKVLRLPSKEDPLVLRIERIRKREEFLIDTLDQQYDGLARDISSAYKQWQRARLREINAIREADKIKRQKEGEAIAIGILGALAGAAISSSNCASCGTAGVLIGGTAVAIAVQHAAQASEQAEAETRLRKTALEELGQSLVNDVQSVVIEVEGKTVELKGTVEQKFQQWRDVLEELRQQEIDLPPARRPAKNA